MSCRRGPYEIKENCFRGAPPIYHPFGLVVGKGVRLGEYWSLRSEDESTALMCTNVKTSFSKHVSCEGLEHLKILFGKL